MVEISRLTPADLQAAGQVLDAAFGRQGMLGALLLAYTLQPEHWFCARSCGRSRSGGEVIATVGAHGYGSLASIGMMAVRPDLQGQGVGHQLIAHLVAHLDRAGYRQLFLEASAAGARLYPKLGFLACGATARMVAPGAGRWPGRPGGATGLPDATARGAPLAAADLPEVIAYDAWVFGVERAAVLRALYERQPERSFITRGSQGEVTGYLIAGQAALGPWQASSPAAAEKLLQSALALNYTAAPRLTLPAENTAGLALLARYGFGEGEKLTHMRRGPGADPRRRSAYYAHASLTLG